MSQGDDAAGMPGRASAFPNPPTTRSAAPAAVNPSVDAQSTLRRLTAPPEDQRATLRYIHHSVSPIPWMIFAAIMMGASYWAIGWSEPVRGAGDIVRSSEWWINITSVLLPAADLRVASYSPMRMWVTLVILMLTAIVIAAWIGRIGRNLRAGRSPFGTILPLLALPAWWVLPITLGITESGARERGDLLIRYLLAFGVLFAQFLLLRWPLLNRVWRAGDLPYDLVSIVLWLPMMIPWSMLLLSTTYTLMVTGDGESARESAWQPTEAMADWAKGVTRATEVGILVLLVVVTVLQHIGIRRDRVQEDARRDAVDAARRPMF